MAGMTGHDDDEKSGVTQERYPPAIRHMGAGRVVPIEIRARMILCGRSGLKVHKGNK
jgi:hypothetical protein